MATRPRKENPPVEANKTDPDEKLMPPKTETVDGHGVRDQTSGEDPWKHVVGAEDLSHFDKMKVLLTGVTGSGKTDCCAKFVSPLVLLFEKQGYVTLRRRNPKFKAILVEKMADIKKFNDVVAHPEFAKRHDAVVVDGLTDLNRMIVDFYTGRQDKQTQFTERDTWGLVKNAMFQFMRRVRDLPVHVVCTAVDEQETVDGRIVHRPAIQGAAKSQLGQFFNLCGYVHKHEVADGIRHDVLFNGPESFITKTMPELDDTEAPEPLLWAHKIFGSPLPADVRARADEWLKRGGEDQPEDKKEGAQAVPAAAPKDSSVADDEDPFMNARAK